MRNTELEKQEPKMKSLYWALKLLDYFDSEHARLGITELAEMSGQLKSSVSNAMATLELLGYVRKHSDSGKYILGHRILSLYNVYKLNNIFVDKLIDCAHDICMEIGETVRIGTLIRDRVTLICSETPIPGMRHTVYDVQLPAHCTALGKALLANSTASVVNAALSGELRKYSDYTKTDVGAIKQELAEIRLRGYAAEEMEFEYGISSVAVAAGVIFAGENIDYEHRNERYSVDICAPSMRLDRERMEQYAALLRQRIQSLTFD